MTIVDLEGYEFDKGSQPKPITPVEEKVYSAKEANVILKLMEKRQSIYEEIELERQFQDGKWGGPKWDDTKGVRDWVTYIVVYLGRAVNRDSEWGRNLSLSRIAIVKVAALCVAALESFDREMMRRVEGAEPSDLEDDDPGLVR